MVSGKILLRGASAGAGKTYFLAKTYIRLLLSSYFENGEDAFKYRHILAVTFTHKATAEMKERILRELAVLATHPSASDYFKDFTKQFSCEEESLKQASQKILYNILHDYGAFSVSTIDSFFQTVLRAFTREIGYYSTYQVELDEKAIIAEAVDRILDALDEDASNKSLLDWISQQAVNRVRDGEKFSSDAVLHNVAATLMSEKYKTAVKLTKVDENALYDMKTLQSMKKSCSGAMKDCRKAIKDASTTLANERNRILGDLVTSRSALEDMLAKFQNFTIDGKEGIPEPTSKQYEKFLTSEGWENPKSWFKKADVSKLSMAEMEDLIKALKNFEKIYVQNLLWYRSFSLMVSEFYGLGVVAHIRKELEVLMKEKNVLTLGQTNEILNELIKNTDTPFVYEKMGVRYENFLLDEFQDTSHNQWNNFCPLLKESVDNGRVNLVVGDPKQSIYRWRNSDASLMTQVLPKAFSGCVDNTHELDTNWRSRENIIHFNNAFFRFAAEKMDGFLNTKLIAPVYEDVSQKTNSKTGGYVRLDFVGKPLKDSELTSADLQLQRVYDSITVAQQNGYSLSDVTIVVRTGAIGVLIANYLGQKNVKVATSDTLRMSASFVVRLLVALLGNFDNPDDKTLLYLIQKHFPNYQKLDFSDSSLVDLCEMFLRMIKEQMPDVFQQEAAYVRCFMDVLHQYVSSGEGGLHGFLQYLDSQDATISAPPSENAVNIITIHKVKGLAAPYVIAPFVDKIDFARVEQKNELLWCSPDLTGTSLSGFPKGIYGISSTVKGSKNTLFEKDFEKERQLAYVDNLNVVYVAFTRSEHVLHIISEDTGARFSSLLKDFSQLPQEKSNGLTAQQSQNEIIVSENSYSYSSVEYGQMPEKQVEKQEEKQAEKGNVLSNEDAYPSYERGTRIQLRTDAGDFFASDELKAKNSECVKGTVVHNILSRIVRPSDLQKAIDEAVHCGELPRAESEVMFDFLQEKLVLPTVKEWFPEGDSDYKIRNEAAILIPGGRDYRTDRVLDNGQEVIIIDYKTGEKNSSYARQMQRYADAYLAMGRKKVSTHLWYLSDDTIESEVYS